jgi:hypothetical protein
MAGTSMLDNPHAIRLTPCLSKDALRHSGFEVDRTTLAKITLKRTSHCLIYGKHTPEASASVRIRGSSSTQLNLHDGSDEQLCPTLACPKDSPSLSLNGENRYR